MRGLAGARPHGLGRYAPAAKTAITCSASSNFARFQSLKKITSSKWCNNVELQYSRRAAVAVC